MLHTQPIQATLLLVSRINISRPMNKHIIFKDIFSVKGRKDKTNDTFNPTLSTGMTNEKLAVNGTMVAKEKI